MTSPAVVVVAAWSATCWCCRFYRWFPPLTVWTGPLAGRGRDRRGGLGWQVRAKINDGEIGDGGGRLHPIAVARSVVIAKASAWVGALVLGWWIGVLAYLLPRAVTLRVAAGTPPGCGRGRVRAGPHRGGAVASALLQVARRTAGQTRRRPADLKPVNPCIRRIAVHATRG